MFVLTLLCMYSIVQVKPFWVHVMHAKKIDLSSFENVPSHKRSLTFEFVDPVWAWVQAACKQPAREMQWVSMKQHIRDEVGVDVGTALRLQHAQGSYSVPHGRLK